MMQYKIRYSDPLDFTEPVPTSNGELDLHVLYTTHHPWADESHHTSRNSRDTTPSVTMRRDYLVQPNDQPIGYPMAQAQCTARFYPTYADAEPDLDDLRALFNQLEESAEQEGIRLHRVDTAWPFKYWMPSFNQLQESQYAKRFSPADRAYRLHESLPEPVAAAVHHELIHNDYGFQLTLDHAVPTIELDAIFADQQSWPNVQQCLVHRGVMANGSPTWQPPPFTSIQLRLILEDRNEPVMLSVPVLPLDDEYHLFTTHAATVEHTQHILEVANTSARKFASFHNVDRDEFLAGIHDQALMTACNTIAPGHAHTALHLYKLSQHLAQTGHRPINEPIALTAPGSYFTIIAQPTATPAD